MLEFAALDQFVEVKAEESVEVCAAQPPSIWLAARCGARSPADHAMPPVPRAFRKESLTNTLMSLQGIYGPAFARLGCRLVLCQERARPPRNTMRFARAAAELPLIALAPTGEPVDGPCRACEGNRPAYTPAGDRDGARAESTARQDCR